MRELRPLVLACLLCCLGAAVAAELPASVATPKADGVFSIAEAEVQMAASGENLVRVANGQWTGVKSAPGRGGLDLSGKLKINGVEGQVTEKIVPLSADSFRVECRYDFAKPTPLTLCCAEVFVPADGKVRARVDGDDLPLPEKFRGLHLLNRKGAKEVRLLLSEGKVLTVRGADFDLAVQDNRQFVNNDTLSFRFHFDPKEGRLAHAALALDFSVIDTPAAMVDLAAVANRGFAYDGKNGWTDQDKDNDLRAFKEREVRAGGLRFAVVDPERNHGNAAVVLGSKQRAVFPHSVTVPLPPMDDAQALNLLHASAWTPYKGAPLGVIRVAYADGSEQTINVAARQDCADWWNPENVGNAHVVWRAENASSSVGLYASSFPLEKDGAVSMTLEAAAPGNALWMIVGATLTADPIHFPAVVERDVAIAPGREWAPLEFSREVVPGSPLDFSWASQNLAPAGKLGRIIPQGGRLVFEKAPQQRVKLFGANLCFTANFLEKGEVDKLIPRLKRLGYNAMRIHHHDSELLDRSAPDTLTLDPQKLDRLDYLFAKLKENGFYVTTSLYVNRVFKRGDAIPECTSFREGQMKTLLPISKAALDNWKEFARRFLGHKNPYTGMTLGEDPALFLLTLVNEDNLASHWSDNPAAAKRYADAFAAWAGARGVQGAKADHSDRHFRQFLDELEGACHAEQIRFCKEELKVAALITSLNWQNDVPLTLMRERFDLVDNHAYFDHPSFPERPWRLPYAYRQRCAIEQLATVPRAIMPARVFGKPFAVTEFNYCSPNLYRAESGALIGAYAALQDWDALFRFAWSHNAQDVVALHGLAGFDAANDPLAQLLDRVAIAMFVRGDVAPAKGKVAFQVPRDFYAGDDPFNFPDAFTRLGLVAQIGALPGDAPLPAGAAALAPGQAHDPAAAPALREAWQRALTGRAASDTGELSLDAQGKTFAVSAPRCLSVTLPGGALRAGALEVEGATGFQSITAISLDGAPVEGSASVLLLHLTNVMNTGTVMGNPRWTLMRDNGRLPALVKNEAATVSIVTGQPFTVTALKLDGSPAGKVSGKYASGKFTFPVATAQGTMVYHLTR